MLRRSTPKFDEFATLNIERQEKWAQLGVKADDAKFICDHVKRRKYVRSELEKQITLAEENATLFKERLQITILARSSVEADCRVHKLCEEIEEADVKLQAFKKQLVEARMTYRATVLEWIGKQQLSKPSTQPTEHESSTSDVAERDARIDALEKQVKEQEDQLKAKDGTIQSLEAKISASEPIQAVGLHALRRRRELQKPKAFETTRWLKSETGLYIVEAVWQMQLESAITIKMQLRKCGTRWIMDCRLHSL